jgi:hypothetical protein
MPTYWALLTDLSTGETVIRSMFWHTLATLPALGVAVVVLGKDGN